MADADPPSPHQPAAKLLSTTSMKLRLALAAGAVLAAGLVLSPPTVSQPLSVPQERAAPLIDEEVQRRDPARLIPDLAALLSRGTNAAVAVVRAPRVAPRTTQDYTRTHEESERPAGYGVVVSTAGDVLSHVAALQGQTVVQIRTPGGATVDARVMAYETSTGLVLLRAALGETVTAPTVTAQEPRPGTPAVGVVVLPEQTVVHPVFVTSSHNHVFSLGGGAGGMLPGMPLYTATGDLFAITGEPPTIAYAVSDAVRRVTVQAASSPGLAPSLGISLQPLEGAVARAFGPTGALVSDVVDGGPASSAGLEPGDVLVGVDEIDVGAVGDALGVIAATTPDTQTTLRIVRNGTPEMVRVTVGTAYTVETRARSREIDSNLFVSVANLVDGERLRAADIPPAARVLRINGQVPSSGTELSAGLQRPRAPVILYLQHESERFFAVLESKP